jgi:hypothetical protein
MDLQDESSAHGILISGGNMLGSTGSGKGSSGGLECRQGKENQVFYLALPLRGFYVFAVVGPRRSVTGQAERPGTWNIDPDVLYHRKASPHEKTPNRYSHVNLNLPPRSTSMLSSL